MKELKVILPEELNQELKQFPAVKWSAVARQLLKRDVESLLELKTIVSKSKFDATDAEELTKKVNKKLSLSLRFSK